MTRASFTCTVLVFFIASDERHLRYRRDAKSVRRPPIPRQHIYDLYWYFASERQQIFERRLAGGTSPWTTDPILRTFKFCSVYRAVDRVSQYLIRNVAYHGEACSPCDRIFQIVAFRTFSKIETWEAVHQFLGRYPLLSDLADGSFLRALEYSREVNGGLYTGAFILCATDAYGKKIKHRNHVELFRHMFLRERLADSLLECKSLAEVFERLLRFPLMGNFMSYQTAIDLNYSDIFQFSENDFTKAGPGALRGIAKVFESIGDYSPEDVILWMVDRQEEEFQKRGLPFAGLWGRPLHAIDCQGLFCETDKYCREAAPELKSGRKRIKTRFRASSALLDIFLPPKWNLRLPITNSPSVALGD